jgi:MoxR-like ATPase
VAEAVARPDAVLALREAIRQVYVADDIRRYVVALVTSVRHHPDVLTGPGPRGTLALVKGARVLAYLDGRDFVLPDDVKALTGPGLVHRVHLKPEAEMDALTPAKIVETALHETAVPKPT